MRGSRYAPLLLVALVLGSPGGVARAQGASEGLARLVAGEGIHIRSVDGVSTSVPEHALAPGLHRVDFDVRVLASSPGEASPRRLHESCEARFRARPGVRYVLVHELVSVRGTWAWRHLLSSGVLDQERDRWVGECVCRVKSAEDPVGVSAR